MAFNHDIDINGAAQGLNLADTSKNVKAPPDSIPSIRPTNGIQSVPSKLDLYQTPQITKQAMWMDPLKALVELSFQCDFDPRRALELAILAANLPETEEIVMKSFTATSKCISNIFGGDSKPNEIVVKKYADLDPSDSDGFGGNDIKLIILRLKPYHLQLKLILTQCIYECI